MGRTLFAFLLQLELILAASASKLILPPVATQAEDGAFAGVRHPVPTAAPEYYASIELLRRDGYNMGHDTCGFGALNSAVTYKCYSTVGTCQDIGSFRGCCTGGLNACSSTFWTQCDDYNPTSDCGISSKTRCCQSALPYCITWLFSTSGSTVTAWDCDTQSDTKTFELLATPLSLIDSTASTSDDSAITSSATDATTSSSATTGDPTAAFSASTAGSSSSANANSASNSSSSTPVGAIVGGVIGGLAVISLIILGIFFIKKYQRRTTPDGSPPPAASGPQELPGSQSPSPYSPQMQEYYSPLPDYNAAGQPKYQVPMTQISPPVEAPDTPATGTGYNRAELA
ncbi:hypothetical protein F4804DRAFT_254962 [Jackrogersella minutella]|nr:hypothetical protein F4804DRAFT_254962 [Jackrogersella minutella]